MHDRLNKTHFLEQHVDILLREGRAAPRANRKFGLAAKESSPIRQYARRRFRESVLSMVSAAYKTESSMPEENI